MRKVVASATVQYKFFELERYLIEELKLSEEAAYRRTARLKKRMHSLKNQSYYAECRFTKWRRMGYRCASFEGWVFAYQAYEDGVIIRDMGHAKNLHEVD